ncbi:MAG: glycosyltransferase WbuB [Chloroflexi bacterium HGW-Chloroflexi-4]|jgi:glycosyltransferase involved in cell wall biosynthesis|nr:MAG: glycosyltransferase WbuB [Chloroflexi bacterium HGW-Chloroflexi-4]
MHILLIHQAFAAINEPGGTRHHEIARYMVKQGHQVTIITSPISYLTGENAGGKTRWVTRDNREPGITILRAYTYPALHRSFVHRILSFFSFMFSSFFIGLGVKKVSAIWGTTPPIFQGWTAWLLSRLKGVPILFEVRDLWPAFAIAVGVLKNKTLIRLSEWLECFLYRHADEMVVNSPGFIDHISLRGAKKITLVENGVDVSMFDMTETGTNFRKTHHLENKFIALYAGAHGISNNLGVVLESAALTLDDPEIAYVFVGDGKEKANLIEEAKAKQLTNILFLSSVPKMEMNAVLAAADACIAILKPIDMYKTTYPNKVFDYMAAAKPVLLLIDGVIRKVVEDAHCGKFIEPDNPTALAEQIKIMHNGGEDAKRMGLNGREYVQQHFNRSTLAAKMEEVFLTLLRINEKSHPGR